MLRSRIVVPLLSGACVLGVGAASAQDYPNKPIRIITAAIGGSNDFLSRLIAQGISGPLGQPVIVENRPNGPISPETVAKAPPDGYTILINGSSFYIAALFQKIPYDPVKDFAPITVVAMEPNVLVVHPSLPVKTVKDLIALAKSRPGELNYSATSSAGGTSALAAELFKSMAGANIIPITYTSNSQELIDLISGQVHLSFQGLPKMGPHIKLGKLRALAVTSAQPTTLAPGLPTVWASGLPGFESISMNGAFAPAKTSPSIVNRLNQEIVRLLRTPEMKERLFNAGTETVGSSPEELAAKIRSELTILGKVIKDAGIKTNR